MSESGAFPSALNPGAWRFMEWAFRHWRDRRPLRESPRAPIVLIHHASGAGWLDLARPSLS